MTKIRRKIAERLVAAQQTAAILTTFNEVDMTGRHGHCAPSTKSASRSARHRPGLHVASSPRLRHGPAANSRASTPSSTATTSSITITCNLGIAVSTERGLAVPVLRNADA